MSMAGDEFEDHRRRLSPLHFEQQLFLKVNSSMWNVADVHTLVHGE